MACWAQTCRWQRRDAMRLYPPSVASLGGDFLRATREQQGISQEELARRVGTHQPQISAWETGKKPIQVEHLAALLSALGMDLGLTAVPRRKQ